MMSSTKEVGVTGKYGNRPGKRIREEIKKIYQERKESKCPECGKKVKRISPGIWFCKRCELKITGGAYSIKK